MRAITDTSPEYPLGLSSFGGFTGRAADSRRRKSTVEVLPPPRDGVWKVRLVIDQKDLRLILSEDGNTEAQIEQMRVAGLQQTQLLLERGALGAREMCSFER